uniref:Uncharacterized protein n=1 Tax=Bosea sp. NBC_00436 TaxID=2969620 RepID=A0A9E7ZVJ2_9HYPH
MTRRHRNGLPEVPAEIRGQVDDAVARAVADANQRSFGLTKLANFAAKQGVTFDLDSAINGEISLAAARRQIADAVAEADEATLTLCRSTSASAESVNHKQGWDAALSTVTARLGLGG